MRRINLLAQLGVAVIVMGFYGMMFGAMDHNIGAIIFSGIGLEAGAQLKKRSVGRI